MTPIMQAHSREYHGPINTEQVILIRCAVGHIPSIRKMGEITTPIATIIARNTMRNVFILCFSILHSSCFSGFLPPKLRNEFPEKSDSYPFFGRSSITSSHSENTDSHRYVNSFCPAAGRSPSGLLCQHGTDVQTTSTVQLDFVFFLYFCHLKKCIEKECALAHPRRAFLYDRTQFPIIQKKYTLQPMPEDAPVFLLLPSVGMTQIRYGRRFIFLSACHTDSRAFIVLIS